FAALDLRREEVGRALNFFKLRVVERNARPTRNRRDVVADQAVAVEGDARAHADHLLMNVATSENVVIPAKAGIHSSRSNLAIGRTIADSLPQSTPASTPDSTASSVFRA